MNKTGIEIKFGKTLKVLSFAVFVDGCCQVSHATTRGFGLNSAKLAELIAIELQRNPKLTVI